MQLVVVNGNALTVGYITCVGKIETSVFIENYNSRTDYTNPKNIIGCQARFFIDSVHRERSIIKINSSDLHDKAFEEVSKHIKPDMDEKAIKSVLAKYLLPFLVYLAEYKRNHILDLMDKVKEIKVL